MGTYGLTKGSLIKICHRLVEGNYQENKKPTRQKFLDFNF
jgi:hypothetical protein